MTINEPGLLRGCPTFDTYEGNFYRDGNNNLVGLQSDDINGGELIGQETLNKITMGVGNLVQGIIEDKDYESLESLFDEIGNAYLYKYKIRKILLKDDERIEKAA